MTVLQLRLTMLSDWHIGTGTVTRGVTTSRVLRDDDGLPFVPAKTLVGVWRDACEVAARACDGDTAGRWHAWVEYLFGSQPAYPAAEAGRTPDPDASAPRPAALLLDGPLRLPPALGQAIAARPRLREAVTFVKPGVALDPRTRTADSGKLRFDEMARGGVTLVGKAVLPDMTSQQSFYATTLLWAGAELLEGIGGKRRRGAGRCELEMTVGNWKPNYSLLAKNPPDPPGPPRPDTTTPDVPAMADAWQRVRLTIEVRTPLIAHGRTIGNLVEGLGHVPGWTLLPAVLSWLGPLRPEAGGAARRGDLVVTSATPTRDGVPSRPMPRVLASPKGDESKVVNRMTQHVSKKDETVKPRASGYVVTRPGEAPVVLRPEFVTRTHNTINDEKQRPTEDLGGVYVYRALRPGTVLAAEVRVRDGVLPDGWADRLAGSWRLGRSRKDDYGRVDVTVEPLPGRPEPELCADGRLRVWLLSDTLVQDERLRLSADIRDLASALSAAFAAAGTPGVVLERVLEEDGLVPTAFAVSRTESWHTGWGLPRPSLLGFAAGGCLTFEITEGRVGPEALAAVELAGVGLRRGEGFGQVSFNDPLLTQAVEEPKQPDKTGEQPDEAVEQPAPVLLRKRDDGDAHAAAELIEQAAWRAEIWRTAESLANKGDVLDRFQKVSVTRLNSLRGVLDQDSRDPETLRKRVALLTERWGDRDGPAARELMTTGDALWNRLELPLTELCLTEGAEERLRDELGLEALRALVSACLAVHTRRAAAAHAGAGS
ncbi:RAMP superfamily CRISPR-associated protein [Actinocorallia sp. API 0066]|uniref:RAMP superfamily CRISPR-associated protein n=1 Tax=Actinocorallia sp. API 0066 TaxID=2896846 RepID=UPI001E597759|nr:RAMP superfamily CRISPR-associated protein [Actinocorallia sp. API 0066]MCD0449401.1 RAMP superfamily CRISPR-associated protein [Actinocorallia sp. API 0066]